MNEPFIRIRRLKKRFERLEVLTGVDIDIEKGESIVVIGQSGCGKSVLLKHLVRLLEPDE
ncbi:MAG: ATP-binding cassette domain-containing protein, partial [candidate division Zixibacteria bacterium]|nr:ATP-binding cassette domain-containing protein [candidate division Zixibacteria bacterium]